jgi:uncharacterized protein YecT (DUF1311 family)
MRRVTGNHGSAKPKGQRFTLVAARPAVAATLLGVILPAGLVHAGPPSFDCGKATTWAERAICASATLSGLDREVGAIYRDARSRASPSAAGALKARQRIWIGRREQCQGNADPTGCLLAMYEQRRTELTAGAGREVSAGVGGKTPARQPLPGFKADVVWRGDSSRIYQQCQFGDNLCARRVMKAEGATEQALRFAQRIDGWAVGFQELGPVDVVTAVGAYAANTLEYLFLVNGTPDLIPLHEYGLDANRKGPSCANGNEPTGCAGLDCQEELARVVTGGRGAPVHQEPGCHGRADRRVRVSWRGCLGRGLERAGRVRPGAGRCSGAAGDRAGRRPGACCGRARTTARSRGWS